MNNKQTNKAVNYYETFYGHRVSDYGLKYGRLDYGTLSKCFDAVLCNNIPSVDPEIFDRLESGDLFEYYDEGGNPLTWDEYYDKESKGEKVYEIEIEIFQYFIVSDNALELLKEAGEIVFYSEKLDCYIWGVTHYGTSWDYVLTSIKLRIKDYE